MILENQYNNYKIRFKGKYILLCGGIGHGSTRKRKWEAGAVCWERLREGDQKSGTCKKRWPLCRCVSVGKNRPISLVFDQQKVAVTEIRMVCHSYYSLSSGERGEDNLTNELSLLCRWGVGRVQFLWSWGGQRSDGMSRGTSRLLKSPGHPGAFSLQHVKGLWSPLSDRECRVDPKKSDRHQSLMTQQDSRASRKQVFSWIAGLWGIIKSIC